MRKLYSISIYLDTRRVKDNNKYPVKLRVYANKLKKTKYYPTKFNFTQDEFNKIWLAVKVKELFKKDRLILQELENRSNEIAESINPFTFDKFEKKMQMKDGQEEELNYHFNIEIDKNINRGSIGNADIYKQSFNSIAMFHAGRSSSTTNIKFEDITPGWLEDYEEFMLNYLKRSKTTVSIYLRAMRSIFNNAIGENDISKEIYPFGKNKYVIPNVRKVKKALSNDQIKSLYESEPPTLEQEKAKDFWFFSYACLGMNIKDIASIRYKDISENKLVYYRSKTINTSKADLKPITVHLNEYALSIIEKYGNSDKSSDNLIFQIISDDHTIFQKYRNIKNFTRFLNQNLKKLVASLELPDEISFYWARHTFSTKAIRDGYSMEFISDALNHSDLRTTQNYMAGFEDDVKKEFSDKLMDF